MSIPGLTLPGLTLSNAPPPTSAPSPTSRTHTLPPRTEYRFESPPHSPLTIKLLSGTAELFGTELAPQVPYNFQHAKGAVYTWHGCVLEITGAADGEYVAEETPMGQYANLHFALEGMRNAAEMGGGIGPRVCVVGPAGSGKTSLVRILTGYAVKARRQTVVVNLDPGMGMLSVPGTLSAATFASLVDVEEGWGSSPISGPSVVPVKMPLVYHLGSAVPEENARLFKGLVTRLALAVTSRLDEDGDVRAGGCVVDTSGSVASGKGGYELIQYIVSEFSVTTLIVLGSERLYSSLKQLYPPGSPTSILKLDKSGGCVDRDESWMRAARQAQIREYFFGRGAVTLSPYTQMLDFASTSIFRVSGPATSSAFDPGASSTADDDDEYEPEVYGSAQDKITPSLALQNSLLAVTHADPSESADEIRMASVMGYVYVADVDEGKKKLRVLSPVSARVPAKALLWGGFPEDVVDLVG
ncbi:Clp1-domain-containing protein [Trichodelitschia bisporula]|uniref:Polynucleotide 5'-hydroxyl-kinase GRC3 n=1 Tax=Trichodelitschia bisporula TaxID=703511 RepID=A0A6G1HHU2_9PEZI|nr:Clp1-domain-containing protein [Trichodelitschia bisporula]